MANPQLKSFHFDIGDSTNGPVGLCARIVAETEAQAAAALKSLLEKRSGPCNEFELWKEGAQYGTVFVNPNFPLVTCIDDQKDVQP